LRRALKFGEKKSRCFQGKHGEDYDINVFVLTRI